MFIKLDEIQEQENTFTKPHTTNKKLIVIDNGTYECKAGYPGPTPQLIFKNKINKLKDKYSLDHIQQSTTKSMFDYDVVTNYECMEAVFDKIFEHLGVEKVQDLVVTECLCNPWFYKRQAIETVFEVYGPERVQFGLGSVYSYLYNSSLNSFSGEGESVLIIDVSHSSSSIIVLDSQIREAFKINFGGAAASEYLLSLLQVKYPDVKINNKQTSYLLRYLRVADDYRTDSLGMLESVRNGEGCVFLEWKSKKKGAANFEGGENFKSEKILKEEEEVEEAEMQEENEEVEDEEVEMKEEEKDEEVQEEQQEHEEEQQELEEQEEQEEDVDALNEEMEETPQLSALEEEKQKKRSKMLFYSTLYRHNQKILKCLKKLKAFITHEEEEKERKEDLPAYLSKIRSRYYALKREQKLKENIIKNLKDKKSLEALLKHKTVLSPEEEKLRARIEEAEDPEAQAFLVSEIDKYAQILLMYDLDFVAYEFNAREILRGDHFADERVCMNIEKLRVPEVLFSPSIIGLSQPGLSEIFDRIMKKYKLKGVFLTGGFSQIENLDKRISDEISRLSVYGRVDCMRAADPVHDAFRGGCLSDLFPIYTKEEYEEYGVDNLKRGFV